MTGTDPNRAIKQRAVGIALRSAIASAICLLVVARFQLPNGFLAVYTAHVINLQYAETPFQKGVERFVGRVAGVIGCTLLFLAFRQTPALCLTLLGVVMFMLFYVQAAGWFAYAITMAAVFSMMTVAIGITEPGAALIHTVWPTIANLLVGVFAAEVVNFLTGFEKSLDLKPGGQPLFPVRAAWVSKAARMTATAFAAVFGALYFNLPVTATSVSAVILTTSPDPKALGWKGWLRILAVLVGSLYAVAVLMIMTQVPSLILLTVLLFLGMFVGTYVGQAFPAYSYLGLQMGIVLGQVLVVPPNEVVDLNKATSRLVGAMAGFGIAMVFAELWPTPSTKGS